MATEQRRQVEDDYTEDRISMLPNEILGLILSSLSLKEAMATSILSSRWRYSWIFTYELDLHIDWIETLQKHRNYDKGTLIGTYVKWVDRLLTTLLPKSSTNLDLVKFRLSFSLSSSFKLWIDNWASYAVSRKVQSLDLILNASFPERNYSFPYKAGNFPDNLKLLRKLSFDSVNVSGETVAFMLGNCRLLEQLSVSRTDALSSLEVVGTLPVFKCLEISECGCLNSVLVRESELVCIKYRGAGCRFMLVDVPLLTQLWIQAETSRPSFSDITDIINMFAQVLLQLRTLKIYCPCKLEDSDIIRKSMPKLNELVVVIESDLCDTWSLRPVINWFRRTPCLERFVVEASHRDMDKKCYGSRTRCYDCGISDGRWKMYRRPHIRRAHNHNKEVEFVGYRGLFNHLQMIWFFSNVDMITIDPRSFELRRHMPWDRISRNHMEDEIFARNLKKDQLKHYLHVNIL